MDKIDKKILEQLQQNSSISNQDLAEKVALSPSPCSRRVKQLEDEGYIKKYVALLDPEKLALSITVLIAVGLVSHEPKLMRSFEQHIQKIPEVVQCYLIAGQQADYMLKIIVPSMLEYQTFLLNKLTRIEGVNTVHSSFILRNIIDKTELPLSYALQISGKS
ncbi:MAG: Lrp/AsnC family transcriptional regulator [Gammaproteobacteria bacterium]